MNKQLLLLLAGYLILNVAKGQRENIEMFYLTESPKEAEYAMLYGTYTDSIFFVRFESKALLIPGNSEGAKKKRKEYVVTFNKNNFQQKAIGFFPEVKEEEALVFGELFNKRCVISVQGGLAFFPVKKNVAAKTVTVYGTRVNTNASYDPNPKPLFSLTKNDFGDKDEQRVSFQENEKKDLVLLTYETKKAAKRNEKSFYYLLDKDLALVHADSTETPPDPDYLTIRNVIMHEDGYMGMVGEKFKTSIKLYDRTKNNTFAFTISQKHEYLHISAVKIINDKIVLIGAYWNEDGKQFAEKGMFKIVYDPGKRTVESEEYFVHVPQGSHENSYRRRYVSASHINEKGVCFFVTSQGDVMNQKYEVVCMNNGKNWRKQLPVGPEQLLTTYFSEEAVFVYCNMNAGYNPNTFVYENPLNLKANVYSLLCNVESTVLRFNKEGLVDVSNSVSGQPKWIRNTAFPAKLIDKEFKFVKTVYR